MQNPCRICGHNVMRVVAKSRIRENLTPSSFAITDSHYGRTGEIRRCQSCGFEQCANIEGVERYYRDLEDPSYEEGFSYRALQAARILTKMQKYHAGRGRLLDIGAASGPLVHEALVLGYDAEGVEPSRWLCDRARARGLPVHCAALPLPLVRGPFDVVTLIDVLEHVENPVELLGYTRDVLAPDGIALVVTPDVNSLPARVLGARWWHRRIAHIGYFNRQTLELAGNNAGLSAGDAWRPTWYFTGDYLRDRINIYLPASFRLPRWGALSTIVIPVNPRDSLAMVFTRK